MNNTDLHPHIADAVNTARAVMDALPSDADSIARAAAFNATLHPVTLAITAAHEALALAHDAIKKANAAFRKVIDPHDDTQQTKYEAVQKSLTRLQFSFTTPH